MGGNDVEGGGIKNVLQGGCCLAKAGRGGSQRLEYPVSAISKASRRPSDARTHHALEGGVEASINTTIDRKLHEDSVARAPQTVPVRAIIGIPCITKSPKLLLIAWHREHSRGRLMIEHAIIGLGPVYFFLWSRLTRCPGQSSRVVIIASPISNQYEGPFKGRVVEA